MNSTNTTQIPTSNPLNHPLVQRAAVYFLIAIAIFGYGFSKGEQSVKQTQAAAHAKSLPKD